jgi:hypothetical protein
MLRRRRILRVASLAGVLAVLTLAAACGGGGEPNAQQPSSTTTTPASAPGPSQSPADADRDGVVAAVAALPLGQRMVVQASVEAPEGVWVVSRIAPSAEQPGQGCRLGPEEGQTPTDWICTTEYGEVLLLDGTQTRILRAYPLAGVPPQFLRLTDDALYCGRPGDGGLLPDSMVCRIDRHTLEATVRIFPGQPDSVVVQPCFYPPAAWAIDDEFLAVNDLVADTTGVRVGNGDGTWRTIDPLTLEPGQRV